MNEVDAVSHGKILWVGGYSVVERPNLSYVTTVDAGVHANLKNSSGDVVRINVPQFNHSVSGNLNRDTGDLSMNVPSELKLVKTAVQTALYYVSSLGVRVSGFNIETTNDPAMSYQLGSDSTKLSKAGLGSSAAVTVASIGAVLTYFGISTSREDALHKLSQTAHAAATGKVGSGFDIAAATYGDIIYSRYSPEIVNRFPTSFDKEDVLGIVKQKWDYSITPMPLPSMFSFALASFVGDSAVTSSMLGSVNEFKKSNPDEYKKIITHINQENETAISALKNISDGTEVDFNLRAFKETFNKGRLATKLLGERSRVAIEPDDITNIIEKTVDKGAFIAKSPGAGGYDAIAAIFLDAQRDRSKLDSVRGYWTESKMLQPLELGRNSTGFEARVKKPIMH